MARSTRFRLAALVSLTSLSAACSQTAATPSASADVTADVAPTDTDDSVSPADAETTDAAANDASAPDAAPDTAATDAAAADSADNGAPDTASNPDTAEGCPQILAKIDALKPALSQCTKEAGCQNFEYPICGSFGCFQLPVAANADTTALQALSEQAAALSCEPFQCGCGEQLSPSLCLNGYCRSCPPDCAGSCDDLTQALLTTAHNANYCASDKDCVVVSTGLCPVGDLPCGGLYVNTYTKQETLQAVVTAFSQACGASTCKCAVPDIASCVGGKCVAK
jgi:hypothetical protein